MLPESYKSLEQAVNGETVLMRYIVIEFAQLTTVDSQGNWCDRTCRGIKHMHLRSEKASYATLGRIPMNRSYLNVRYGYG
jgi:hypothetical protein